MARILWRLRLAVAKRLAPIPTPTVGELLDVLRSTRTLGAKADRAIADDEWASARSYLLEADKQARDAIEKVG